MGKINTTIGGCIKLLKQAEAWLWDGQGDRAISLPSCLQA